MRFRWLAALTLWTTLIGPVLVAPVWMFRPAVSSGEAHEKGPGGPPGPVPGR